LAVLKGVASRGLEESREGGVFPKRYSSKKKIKDSHR